IVVLPGHEPGRSASRKACLEFRTRSHSSAVFIDYFTQPGTHRQLNRAWNIHSATYAVYFRAGPIRGGAQPFEPRGTVAQNMRDIGQGFHIVHNRRLTPEALLGRIRRRLYRVCSFPHYGVEKRGRLPADVSSSASVNDNVKRKIRAQNVIAQKTRLSRVFQLAIKYDGAAFVGGTHEKESLGSRKRVTRQDHPLDYAVWVNMDQHAVLECSGLHLVAVCGKVAGKSARVRHRSPFLPGRKTGAASAQQAGFTHQPYDLPGRNPAADELFERLVPTAFSVFVQGRHPVWFPIFEQYQGILGHELFRFLKCGFVSQFIENSVDLFQGQFSVYPLVYHHCGSTVAIADTTDRQEREEPVRTRPPHGNACACAYVVDYTLVALQPAHRAVTDLDHVFAYGAPIYIVIKGGKLLQLQWRHAEQHCRFDHGFIAHPALEFLYFKHYIY